MKKPLISIIIPCYNDSDYIEQAVNSVFNQTYTNKEIIVVDDGSNQKTKDILKGLESKINILITQENQGQSKARNIGVNKAQGKYILVLDSDDYFELEFCEQALNMFLQSNDIKIITCYANLIVNNKNTRLYKPPGGSLEDMLLSNTALGSVMFKKQDWSYVGGYDEGMRNGFEDWEFYIRLLSRGGRVFVINKPLFNYRQRHNSTTSRANKNKFELLKFIYIKNKDLYIDKFEITINHLIKRIEREEKEKIKNTERLEFKIGKVVLMPLRLIKSLLR